MHAPRPPPLPLQGRLIPLQRATLQLPGGHGLGALTFVLRSEDGELAAQGVCGGVAFAGKGFFWRR